MKIISGHQAVYLPWLGLFHKLALCDEFVFMDTVQYLDGDWNNRNKIRTTDGWCWLSLPIDKKKSSGKMLDEIIIKENEHPDPQKCWPALHWKSIEINYSRSTFFKEYADDLKEIYLGSSWHRLIDLCWAQFSYFVECLDLNDKKIVRMSEHDFEGKKDRLVLDHCRKLEGDAVVFGTHGKDYVDKSIFSEAGIRIYFQNYIHPQYSQRFEGFESHLSIIDLLFNHGPESRNILMENNHRYEDLLRGELWEQ